MRFAYADPPYIGCAGIYPEKQEVDHAALVDRLVAEFPDGWALSCHTASLRYLLPLCPESVRVLAWTKPFAAFKKRVRPQFAWEPVILFGGRPPEKRSFTCVRDWHSEMPTVFSGEYRGIKGCKSRAFCLWLLDCFGYEDGDEIVDLYPGSGIMGACGNQGRLAL